jgi:ubiquinone/menaquinone biosynthesis C-methylase UbiE
MAEPRINFTDGDAYERTMGAWSRLAGEIFLDWLAPAAGLRWIDVGCGSGAFTQLVVERSTPAAITAIDPSEEQLVTARRRLAASRAEVLKGDAMALPFPDDRFDVAIMALVIFFVPQPDKGVAEMVRVVRPGGTVAAYAWDILGGGFPFAPVQAELRAAGLTPPLPPSVEASRAEALRALWSAAGLENVELREITVQRTFEDFDDYWWKTAGSPSLSAMLAKLGPAGTEALKGRVRARLQPGGNGQIVTSGRANAIRGRVAVSST